MILTLRKLISWLLGLFIFIIGLSLLTESVILSIPILIEGLLITSVFDRLIQKRFNRYEKWKTIILVSLIPGLFLITLFNYNHVAKAITINRIKKVGGIQIVNNEVIDIFKKKEEKFKSIPKVGDFISSEDAPLLNRIGNNVKYSNGFKYDKPGHKQELPHIYISCGGLLTYYSIIIYDPRETIKTNEIREGLYPIFQNFFLNKPNPLKHFIHYFNTR